MFRIIKVRLLGLTCLAISCQESDTRNPIEVALASESSKIQTVMDNLEAHEVQIALSVVDSSSDQIQFTDYEFQVNDSLYFYPASTVKFPVAVLSLEQLHNNGIFDLDVQYTIEGDSVVTTFRSDIEAVFAVSSNQAYNNLYEWLGKDYINGRLQQLGIQPARISHRLSTANADNLNTKSIEFTKNGTTSFLSESMVMDSIKPLQLKRLQKGKGYYANDSLINKPMDFSYKNYFPITSLHNTMKRVIFPELYGPKERFDLTPDLQSFLLEAMQQSPSDAGYNAPEYYDSYVKFFMFGDSKDPMPSDIIIHNKVGYAYGYLTDTAYIVDTTNNLAFVLTATIHVNKDGVFNDDVYEYESIGIPFLAQLGREIHQNLVSRK